MSSVELRRVRSFDLERYGLTDEFSDSSDGEINNSDASSDVLDVESKTWQRKHNIQLALEYLGPACQHLGYDDVSLSLDTIEKELVEIHMGQRQTSKDHHKIISEFVEQRATKSLEQGRNGGVKILETGTKIETTLVQQMHNLSFFICKLIYFVETAQYWKQLWLF